MDMSDTQEKRADMPDAEEDKVLHTVRFEPVGVEMTVEEGETVLDAAFRQGISVMHGCKEGQCSSCKSLLIEAKSQLSKNLLEGGGLTRLAGLIFQ